MWYPRDVQRDTFFIAMSPQARSMLSLFLMKNTKRPLLLVSREQRRIRSNQFTAEVYLVVYRVGRASKQEEALVVSRPLVNEVNISTQVRSQVPTRRLNGLQVLIYNALYSVTLSSTEGFMGVLGYMPNSRTRAGGVRASVLLA
jgi:hypothetical protein